MSSKTIQKTFDLSSLTAQQRNEIEHFIFAPIGQLTGKVAFDKYAYCWFELEGYHLSVNKKGWVRETAINYGGKTDLQAWIDAQRMILFPELYSADAGTGVTQKFSLKDILKWAAIGFGVYKLGGG
jgi:hypothetical protein